MSQNANGMCWFHADWASRWSAGSSMAEAIGIPPTVAGATDRGSESEPAGSAAGATLREAIMCLSLRHVTGQGPGVLGSWRPALVGNGSTRAARWSSSGVWLHPPGSTDAPPARHFEHFRHAG